MRKLLEEMLNIPVVQARLNEFIAGITIDTQGGGGEKVCGFILNTVGENTNVLVRRTTLAYELGHFLWGLGQEGTFGISYTAACRHVSNVYSGEFAIPEQSRNVSPPEVWVDREGFIRGDFPIASTPPQRRGRFAGLVAEGYREGLLSSQTAALYLGCDEREFLDRADYIRSLCVL